MSVFKGRTMFGFGKKSPEEDKEKVVDAEEHSSFSTYLKESITKTALKGKLALEHAAGLGHRPNVIPEGEANVKGEQRKVHIGWHPVGGVAGKWFSEQTKLGKLITEKVREYPDPTQHWAVLVGDYVHQLWMDENLDVIYINENLVKEEWHMYEVGYTTFNDQAMQEASEMAIYNMREARPAYNLITNNCQNFALNLLDAVQMGKHREFGSTFAIYQRATGKGKIADLFVDDGSDTTTSPPAVEEPVDPAIPKPQRQNTVQFAAQVMDEHTTKLDTHHSLH